MNLDDDSTRQPDIRARASGRSALRSAIACVLVGLVISWPAVVLGAALTIVFGAALDPRHRALARPGRLGRGARARRRHAVGRAGSRGGAAPARRTAGPGSSSLATIGLGGVIGAAVTLPSLGFAVLPSFMGEGVATNDVDLGPISNFPEGTFVITTFIGNKLQGEVSKRTAYIRNNGLSDDKEPSFTILFSRCVHLGCPVQPNGPEFEDKAVKYKDVSLTPGAAGRASAVPATAAPTTPRATAPPAHPSARSTATRSRSSTATSSLGDHFSVGTSRAPGPSAKISRYRQAYPGVHVDGLERWLYPIPVPGS